MKPVKLGCAIALVLAAVPLVSFAQDAAEAEASSPFSWNATVTSDYVWRGVTQTDEDPAFQTGLTYTSPVGIYGGVWGSNVDFGAGDPDFEVDGFIGYNTDFGNSVNFDAQYYYYNYPGASDSNWGELITKTTLFDHYNLTVAYSPDTWATSENGFYYALGTSWDLPYDFSLSASYGYSTFSSKARTKLDGQRDYADWSVGVGKSFGPLTVAVTYTDTNGSGDKNFGYQGDSRVAVSLSVDAP